MGNFHNVEHSLRQLDKVEELNRELVDALKSALSIIGYAPCTCNDLGICTPCFVKEHIETVITKAKEEVE